MKIAEFNSLRELKTKGTIILKDGVEYAEAIYKANIPFRPGIYLIYSLNKEGEDQNLLYFGKAGVTKNKNQPKLNFHPLPLRLIAATKRPQEFKETKSADVTRAKLWPWYVKNNYKNGIKIYWYITEWPKQNPNDFETKIGLELKEKYSKWKKSI
jgi:hypothetical protein